MARVRVTGPTIIGLDLSLRGPAAVAIPFDWAFDWKLQHATFGYELKEPTEETRIERLLTISRDVRMFIRRNLPKGAADASGVKVYVENYAFSRSSSSVTKLAELGGIVRGEVWREFGLTLTPVTASSARKLFLGHCPKGAKEMVEAELAGLDAPFKGNDECDAFVVANFGRAEHGLAAFTLNLSKA
jgi:hypothetical protein